MTTAIDRQFGYTAEGFYGTYAVADHFTELLSEAVQLNIDRKESQGIHAAPRVSRSDRWAANKRTVAGALTFEVASKGFGLMFKHWLGAIATTVPAGGVNSRTHTATLADLTGLSLTLQIGRPDNTGVMRPFSYVGCKLLEGELTNTVDGVLLFGVGVDGADEDTTQALAGASYPSTSELLSFIGGSATIGGVQVATLHDVSIKASTPLNTNRYGLRADTRKNEPIPSGLVAITGTMTAEFESLTAYNRYVNGSLAAIVADWKGKTALEGTIFPELQVTLPVCRFDGDTPMLADGKLVAQNLRFAALYDGTQQPISVAYTTLDLTP